MAQEIPSGKKFTRNKCLGYIFRKLEQFAEIRRKRRTTIR
jgi:hypothetical protein